jgi:hypothetical protein
MKSAKSYHAVLLLIYLLPVSATSAAIAADEVEFDFARVAECRDVTPLERIELYPNQRLVEFVLPISVRFRGIPLNAVEELTIEINGSAAGLRVHDFAPETQLASDIAQEIEMTTTTKSGRSLDATLGGALPVPFAATVANVSPSISAGTSTGETITEKLNRLPPKHAVVVSGTSAEGRGVFIKLKRSSQTSLEGVHEVAVTFVAPAGWWGGEVQVGCSARGERKILWVMTQDATWGSEGDKVRLYLASGTSIRRVAKPILVEAAPTWRPTRRGETSAAEVANMVKAATTTVAKRAGKGNGNGLEE